MSVRRLGRSALALIAVALLTLGCARGDGAAPPTAAPPARPRVGADGDGSAAWARHRDHRLFAGIPYAAPPVGALRWQPPPPAATWPGVRDATKFGPRCHAGHRAATSNVGRPTGEDCLTLNVWTPPRGRSATRPVMVWIHGGAFVIGSGGVYDSRWLAARGDIVVVTINYRLGALGFLAHPALGPAGRGRQLRARGPAGGAALGTRQHRRVRRRSAQSHHRGRIGRWDVGVRPPRRARIGRTVPGGDHPKRAVSGASSHYP